jgi:hypothetical protein
MISPIGSRKNRRSTKRRNVVRRMEFECLEPRRLLASLFVTTLADVVDPHDGVVSIREAIETANTNGGDDVIKFKQEAREGTISLDPNLGELVISENLEIKGPGAGKLTISGIEQTRVFHVVSEVSASFSKMTIADGLAVNAPGYLGPAFAFGGGISNQGGTVNLFRVTMNNNQAGVLDNNGDPAIPIAAGGAVANEFGGVLTVSHSTFFDNTAAGLFTGVGGAITSDRGDSNFGIGEPDLSPSPVVEISHSHFYNNTASNLFGPTPAVPVLSGFALGGALLNLAGSMDVTHSSFEGNQALAGQENVGGPSIARGGAIFAMDFSAFGSSDATLNVSHSSFHENVAVGGVSTTGVGGEATGGAITGLEGAEVNVHHSLFVGNQAIGGQGLTGGNGTGGAIGVDVFASLVSDPFPSLTVTHSKFIGNQASGGIAVDGGLGGIGRGGAIASLGGSTTELHRNHVFANYAVGGNSGGNGQGGGIYNGVNSTTTMTRSFVMSNHAVGGLAGGIGQGGGLFNDLGEDGDADDGLFEVDAFTKFFTRFNGADDGEDFFGFDF